MSALRTEVGAALAYHYVSYEFIVFQFGMPFTVFFMDISLHRFWLGEGGGGNLM